MSSVLDELQQRCFQVWRGKKTKTTHCFKGFRKVGFTNKKERKKNQIFRVPYLSLMELLTDKQKKKTQEMSLSTGWLCRQIPVITGEWWRLWLHMKKSSKYFKLKTGIHKMSPLLFNVARISFENKQTKHMLFHKWWLENHEISSNIYGRWDAVTTTSKDRLTKEPRMPL